MAGSGKTKHLIAAVLVSGSGQDCIIDWIQGQGQGQGDKFYLLLNKGKTDLKVDY